MKKIIFILGLAAVVLGTSCSDVLDLNPADRFSPATVWSTTTTACLLYTSPSPRDA